MISIRIDLPPNIVGNMTPSINQAIRMSVSSTLMATKSHWESIAQRRLKTTRIDYLLGLQAAESVSFPDPYTGILTLKGRWPNMLESGFPAYDMKKGFKSGARVKQKKDGGWYQTIPFRHRTPNSSGVAAGGQAMPQDIYAQARLLRGQTPGQKRDRLRGTEVDHAPKTSWTGYQHRSGIYEGMVKNRKLYNSKIQSSYFTFRRVSDKSDPLSWMHPGFSGLKAIAEVEQYARNTFERVLQYNLRAVMG